MAGKCFVPYCTSGLYSVRQQCKKENKKHPEMFSAPKNWAMLQIWCNIIPNPDKKFSITDKICGLHFPEEYIAKFHELPLEDGRVFKLERAYARLKPGAIPTVFSSLPQYSKCVQKIVDQMRLEFPLHVTEMDLKIDERMESYLKEISEVRKAALSYSEGSEDEIENSSSYEEINVNIESTNTDEMQFCSDDELASDTGNKKVEINISDKVINTESRNLEPEYRNISNIDQSACNSDVNTKYTLFEDVDPEENADDPDEITFDVLVRNLNYVSVPNNSWSVTSHEKFVICAKWNQEYLPEKKVVIDRDLNIRVFLNDYEIAAYNNLCISEISDISNILSILEK